MVTKNLVVCCDGTWKRASDRNVTNIEKIARAIAEETPDGVLQIVHYSSGVGTGGGLVDRIVGGAFGIGLDSAIVDAYRFLALNYRPGDRVYIFGFSRGAYTARSLGGLIGKIGLLTPEGVAAGHLADAISLYRDSRTTTDTDRARVAYRAACHRVEDVTIRFLGVFDTVGALGVPGLSRRKYRFHDVTLNRMVGTARQALAIGERRRVFAPCLWGGWHPDIKQVWFDGVHTDVGGGYADCALADVTLGWMVREAEAAGLSFDHDRISPNLRPTPRILHNSLTGMYRITNVLNVIGGLARVASWTAVAPVFARGYRTFAPQVDDGRAYDVRVALPAVERLTANPDGWRVNPNLRAGLDEVAGYGGDIDTLVVDP